MLLNPIPIPALRCSQMRYNWFKGKPNLIQAQPPQTPLQALQFVLSYLTDFSKPVLPGAPLSHSEWHHAVYILSILNEYLKRAGFYQFRYCSK